jgi:hypothetical protein
MFPLNFELFAILFSILDHQLRLSPPPIVSLSFVTGTWKLKPQKQWLTKRFVVFLLGVRYNNKESLAILLLVYTLHFPADHPQNESFIFTTIFLFLLTLSFLLLSSFMHLPFSCLLSIPTKCNLVTVSRCGVPRGSCFY